MKFILDNLTAGVILSHPSRGAWIEILRVSKVTTRSGSSHPSRGAWIEISF